MPSRNTGAASGFPAAYAAIAFAAAMAGCYPSRWTHNYSNAIDNAEADNAVLEETGRDEESERLRRERLLELKEEEGDAYKINAGDQIEIRIYGHDDLGMVTRVGPDGTVGMVFLGQVMLAGRTISEARDTIEKGLSLYIKHPVASVMVREVAGETVTVSGAVSRPGLYSISATSRLADAYAMAGGSAERLFNGVGVDIADLEHSILVRDEEVVPADFMAAIERGDPLENVRLKKGDYIFIAQRMESSVTICGEVPNPHRRLYDSSLGLVEALTTAGWMLETHWSHVIIIRNGLADPKMYKVDIDGIMAGRCANFKLQPNDIIYVPKDTMSEYNVFVRKLLPTAQIFNLIKSGIVSYWHEK